MEPIENINEELGLSEDELEAQRIAKSEARRKIMHKKKRQQIWGRRVFGVLILGCLIWGVITGVRKIPGYIAEKRLQKEQETIAKAQEEIELNKPSVEIIEEQTQELDNEEETYFDSEYGPYASEYSEEKSLFFEGYKVEMQNPVAYPSEDDVLSTYAVVIDADEGKIIASKGAEERINPASMTKILTVLVAAEHVVNLDDTYLIDISITDYCYKHDCSAVGFARDEVVSIRDLMYGTILPSGADAAIALAEYVAGDQDRFVEMMNDKLEELGLSDTAHFTNCTGIYNENHYCTLSDMAMIMKAAVENDLAKEILTAHTYTTSKTEAHPDGITISNWFLRRIEDKDTKGEVVCAKTGFVNESGCCAASYEKGDNGKHYIVVTADAWSSWRCIYDHVALYDAFVK